MYRWNIPFRQTTNYTFWSSSLKLCFCVFCPLPIALWCGKVWSNVKITKRTLKKITERERQREIVLGKTTKISPLEKLFPSPDLPYHCFCTSGYSKALSLTSSESAGEQRLGRTWSKVTNKPLQFFFENSNMAVEDERFSMFVQCKFSNEY